MIMRVEDVALRNFCIRAYNDGIAELQAAGITVVEGVLGEEIAAMLAGWVRRNSRLA